MEIITVKISVRFVLFKDLLILLHLQIILSQLLDYLTSL